MDEAQEHEGTWSDRVDTRPGQDSRTEEREPHWRDFARGEAKDFMWSEDAHFAAAAGENEVHSLRLRIEDIADQLAGIARKQSETAIDRVPSPAPRAARPAPAPRAGSTAPRAGHGQIEIIERTIHDIIRHLEASDRHHADALHQMQDDLQMLLKRGVAERSDDVLPDMEAAFSRIEQRIQSLAARIEAAEKPEQGADMSRIESRLASLADSIEKLAHRDDNQDTRNAEAMAETAADAIDQAHRTANAEAQADEEMTAETAEYVAGTAPVEANGTTAEDDDFAAVDLVFEAITDRARAAENEISDTAGESSENLASELPSTDMADEGEAADETPEDTFAGAKERLSDFMRRQERRRLRLRAEAAGRLREGAGAESARAELANSPDEDEYAVAEADSAPPAAQTAAPDLPERETPAPDVGDANEAAEEKSEIPAGRAQDPASDLSGELDRRADMLDTRLAERFAELSARLQSSLREAGDANTLSALKQQVGEMAARLDELATRPRADDGEAELTSQIGDLAGRLAAAEARFASIDTLEYSLSELTGRLDKAEETLQQSAQAGRANARELDRQFAALFEQLEVSRESMLNAARLAATEIAETAAAESAKKVAEDAVRQAQRAAVTAACEAARQAVAEAPPAKGDDGESKIISQLRDSLMELRAEIQSNDREGRAALDAVEDNLRALALRFDEWDAREPAPEEKSAARTQSPGEAKNPAAEPAAAGDLPDDLAALRLPPLEIAEPAIPDGPELGESTGKDDSNADDEAHDRAVDGPRGEEKTEAEEFSAEPPIAKGPEDIASEPIGRNPTGRAGSLPREGAEEPAPHQDGDEELGADSLKRREPGAGPPSAILDSLGLNLPTSFDKRDLPDRKAGAAVEAESTADQEPVPSLGRARTTNELLAAARRAAEAASNQVPDAARGNQSLRERLRIPLSRKEGKSKPADAPAKKKAVKAAKTKAAPAEGGMEKAAIRKPILLAAAAVILIAGSFEVYSMLKGNSGEVIDATPVVEPELPARAPEGGADDAGASPSAVRDSSLLDKHLPTQGGAVGEAGTDSGEPADDTTSSLSTDPRAEPSPRPQPENATAAELPPLSAGIGPDALRQAATGGDPIAQFEVASRLAEGRGVDPDPATAAKWYRLAAASGLAPAQYRLGSLYEKGIGVAKDRVTAGIWYRRAADQGNRKAMHNLAVLNADGIEGQPDFATAARWFRAAAELGLNDSQYNLGILHVRGLGVPQNLAEAYKWFAILAAHGDDDSAQRRDAVARQMDASAVAAARLAAKTWKARPLIAQANAVRLPQSGWAAPEPASEPGLPGPEIIRAAQRLLSQGGYQPGPADGQWGPMTQTAIRSFQRDSGLDATGVLTPELLQNLHRRLAG